MYSIVPVWPVLSLFPLNISSDVPKSEMIALGLLAVSAVATSTLEGAAEQSVHQFSLVPV